MIPRTTLLPLLLAAAVPAQSTTISPPKPLNCPWYKAPFNRKVGDHLGGTGVINYEGVTLGMTNHFQCLDGSQKGKNPMVAISQVAFHQYGATCSPCNSGAERYASVTVTMAEFDYDKASTSFAGNLTTNATVVLNNTAVSLPDWSRLPNSFTNSPYDLVFPFSSPYTYAAANDLCTDIVASGASFTGTRRASAAAVLDSEPVYSCSLLRGNPNGQGCRVSGQTEDFDLFVEVAVSSPTQAAFNLRVARGMPGQPAMLGVAPVGATANVPGWCQPVLAAATVFVPAMLTNTGQWNPSFAINSYSAAQVGVTIFAQVATDDPRVGQFLLTNIAETTTPRQKLSGDKFRFKALSVADNTSATGTLTMRAPVVQYTHR